MIKNALQHCSNRHLRQKRHVLDIYVIIWNSFWDFGADGTLNTTGGTSASRGLPPGDRRGGQHIGQGPGHDVAGPGQMVGGWLVAER